MGIFVNAARIELDFIIWEGTFHHHQSTYAKMFEMLKGVERTLNPTSIICNFEQAPFRAMKKAFPEVEIKGCFFHLCTKR